MKLSEKIHLILMGLLLVTTLILVFSALYVYKKENEWFNAYFPKEELPVIKKPVCAGGYAQIEVEYEISKIVPVKVIYQMVDDKTNNVYRSRTADFISPFKYMKFIDNNYPVPSDIEPGVYRIEMDAFYTVNQYKEPYHVHKVTEWFEVINCKK